MAPCTPFRFPYLQQLLADPNFIGTGVLRVGGGLWLGRVNRSFLATMSVWPTR